VKSFIEETLQKIILLDLEKGRKDFDRPHTKAVVYWTKEILNRLNLSESKNKVLITAAYAHDWGYIGLFEDIDSTNLELVHQMKLKHMERGAKMIYDLLSNRLSKYFTTDEIAQVTHLVDIHDKLEELKSEDEIILMEADTLGSIDVDKVKPTYSKADTELMIKREIRGRRLPIFRHDWAKIEAEKLIQKRLAWYIT
jgi:Asp-tRNA(Asn)/Glu-tRNA(Gln) amidotransferase C subunit